MYEGQKGVPTPMNMPVGLETGESKPLMVRTEQLHIKAKVIMNKAEMIFGELYSENKGDGVENVPTPRMNLDSTISETNYILSSIDSCLSEILYRLSGRN
jgi:hypothetical protein